MSAASYADLPADHFDVVIVDEFHHAAATSYEVLLDHVRPVELLGPTATPERADGLPVLAHFDGRIAAELRLWDAIDQHRLSPFTYFGINDGLDLTEVPWRRARGYDVDGLTNLYTAKDACARLRSRSWSTRRTTPPPCGRRLLRQHRPRPLLGPGGQRGGIAAVAAGPARRLRRNPGEWAVESLHT